MKQFAFVIVIIPLIAACSNVKVHENRTVSFDNKKIPVVYFAMRAVLSIDSVTWDYFPEQDVFEHETEEEMQFVRISLEFKNESFDMIPFSYSSFGLRAGDEQYQQTNYINSGNVDDILESQEIGPGESASGAVYFEIPVETETPEIMLVYTGYDDGDKEYELHLD